MAAWARNGTRYYRPFPFLEIGLVSVGIRKISYYSFIVKGEAGNYEIFSSMFLLPFFVKGYGTQLFQNNEDNLTGSIYGIKGLFGGE